MRVVPYLTDIGLIFTTIGALQFSTIVVLLWVCYFHPKSRSAVTRVRGTVRVMVMVRVRVKGRG